MKIKIPTDTPVYAFPPATRARGQYCTQYITKREWIAEATLCGGHDLTVLRPGTDMYKVDLPKQVGKHLYFTVHAQYCTVLDSAS